MQSDKAITEHIQDIDNKERDIEAPQIQSFDKLSVWQAAKLYKRIGFFCFLAAFSASLDGYQGTSPGMLGDFAWNLPPQALSTARSFQTRDSFDNSLLQEP